VKLIEDLILCEGREDAVGPDHYQDDLRLAEKLG